MGVSPKPHFFEGPDAFRAWLEANHSTETEVLVGFYKKHTCRRSMTWEETVREALCFGWIDGLTRRMDDDRYWIRFTPRKRNSNWSAANVQHVKELLREGHMRPAGLAAFEARTPPKTGVYSYENRHEAKLTRAQQQRFRADERAWSFFREQPPGYRQSAIFWVVSAKREETRERRLATLIDDSAHGRRIAPLRPSEKPSR